MEKTSKEETAALKQLLKSTKPSLLSSLRLWHRRPTPEPRIFYHFIRHGQAQHNLKALSETAAITMHNPGLTQRGFEQSYILSKSFPYMGQVTHILVSPLRRTLETALIGFADIISNSGDHLDFKIALRPIVRENYKAKGKKWERSGKGNDKEKERERIEEGEGKKKIRPIAWHEIREWGDAPCNTGASLESLRAQVGGKIELGLLEEGWEDEGDEEGSGGLSRDRRALEGLSEFREGVLGRSGEGMWRGVRIAEGKEGRDVHLVVVGHGAFLSTLLGFKKPCFRNAQCKSYEIIGKMDHGLENVEWREIKSEGGGRPYAMSIDDHFALADRQRDVVALFEGVNEEVEEDWSSLGDAIEPVD